MGASGGRRGPRPTPPPSGRSCGEGRIRTPEGIPADLQSDLSIRSHWGPGSRLVRAGAALLLLGAPLVRLRRRALPRREPLAIRGPNAPTGSVSIGALGSISALVGHPFCGGLLWAPFLWGPFLGALCGAGAALLLLGAALVRLRRRALPRREPLAFWGPLAPAGPVSIWGPWIYLCPFRALFWGAGLSGFAPRGGRGAVTGRRRGLYVFAMGLGRGAEWFRAPLGGAGPGRGRRRGLCILRA